MTSSVAMSPLPAADLHHPHRLGEPRACRASPRDCPCCWHSPLYPQLLHGASVTPADRSHQGSAGTRRAAYSALRGPAAQASRSSTLMRRRPVSIQPRSRIDCSAFTTESREHAVQPASSSCAAGSRSGCCPRPPSRSAPTAPRCVTRPGPSVLGGELEPQAIGVAQPLRECHEQHSEDPRVPVEEVVEVTRPVQPGPAPGPTRPRWPSGYRRQGRTTRPGCPPARGCRAHLVTVVAEAAELHEPLLEDQHAVGQLVLVEQGAAGGEIANDGAQR